MKKFLLIPVALIIVLALALCGCQQGTTTTTEQSGTTSTTTSTTTSSSGSGTTSTTTSGTTSSSEETWTIKMSFEQSMEAPFTVYGHVPWAEDVEAATNGRVKVEMYPSSTLTSTKDAYDAIVSGLADVALFFGWIQPGRFDRIDCVQLPFLFTSGESGGRTTWAVFNEYPEVQEQWSEVKMLACWTTDPYVFITTEKQIKTLEDFDGMKLRMPGGVATEMVKLLGGTPVSVAMPDNYENLQKGVIDGMGAPGEAIQGWRFYEVCPYYTMVPTVPAHQELIMNLDKWNSFPADIQEAIMSVSGETQAIRYSKEAFDGVWERLPAIVADGGYEMNTYTPPDDEIQRWIDVGGTPLYETWIADMEAKGLSNAREIVEFCQETAAKYN